MSANGRCLRAIVFDFDGLILDTETALYETWRDVFAEQGWPLDLQMWGENVGGKDYGHFDPHVFLREQILDEAECQAIEARQRAAYLGRLAGEDCLPGVRDAIAHAKERGLRLAVASSSSRAWVSGHLTRLGLIDNFESLSCRDDVHEIKPHPALYLRALEHLGTDAAHALAIEDSPPGSLAAKRAGMRCLVVPNSTTRHLDFSHVDRCVASLDAVPFCELLADIEGGTGRAL